MLKRFNLFVAVLLGFLAIYQLVLGNVAWLILDVVFVLINLYFVFNKNYV
jgi:hypothetical protein